MKIRRWIDDNSYWSNQKFLKAKIIYPLVILSFETGKSIWFKINGYEVRVDKEKMVLNCTCKEGSVYPESLCEHKISVLVWKCLNG